MKHKAYKHSESNVIFVDFNQQAWRTFYRAARYFYGVTTARELKPPKAMKK